MIGIDPGFIGRVRGFQGNRVAAPAEPLQRGFGILDQGHGTDATVRVLIQTTDGRTLPRYEEARVELAARNGTSAPSLAQVQSKGFFATLFGWEEPADSPAVAPALRLAAVGDLQPSREVRG